MHLTLQQMHKESAPARTIAPVADPVNDTPDTVPYAAPVKSCAVPLTPSAQMLTPCVPHCPAPSPMT
jgi:hypothetical protein